MLSGRRRNRFLVYEELSRQWRQEYKEVTPDAKSEWVKNKIVERQLIREVCVLVFRAIYLTTMVACRAMRSLGRVAAR